MEPQGSSKRTRSYRGVPEGAHNAQNTLATGFGSHPQYKEHAMLAPMGVSQSEEPLQHSRSQKKLTGEFGRECQASDTNSGSLSSTTSTTQQQTLPIKRHSANSQVILSNSSVLSECLLIPPKVEETGEVQEFSLAVVGCPAVGKSTFVHRALDLKKASSSRVSSKKMCWEGRTSIVQLLEIGLEDVEVTAEQKVLWPEKVRDQDRPDIDGVLALYDVMDQSSIAPMPSLLKALSKHAVPTILVSAKCDNPFQIWEVDQDTVEEFCGSLQGIETFQTSVSAPETHRRCISMILRSIMQERRGKEVDEVKDREASKAKRSVRLRALTNTQIPAAPLSSSSSKVKSKHGRAASEIPSTISQTLGGTAPRPPSRGWAAAGKSGLEHLGVAKFPRRELVGGRRSPGFRPPLGACDYKALLSTHDQKELNAETSKTKSDASVRPHPSKRLDAPRKVVQSLCDPIEIVQNTVADPDVIDSIEGEAQVSGEERPKEPGVSFEDLVDRLLSQPILKSDAKFATIFLCLYRKFAPPSTLVLAVIRRFDELNDKATPYMTRIASQLRYLNILKEWVSYYPGDFAHPTSQRIMTGFLQRLTMSQEHAIASKEISPYLDVVCEDDDTGWACSDKSRSRANTMDSLVTMSSVQSTALTLNAESPTLTSDSSIEDVIDHSDIENPPTSQPNRTSASPSLTSSDRRSDGQPKGSSSTLLNTVENAQHQAQLLAPVSRNMLTKVQWHQLMEIPEEQIARELTRIDWIMFSSIKLRDLIRHVSLQNDQKDKCKSLEHVNRMIHQFNHVAFWVTNMILLRDKPKHRAKALEKFMGVAWKLRHLNNYNALGAVIAGVNGTAVHRLLQTRELVPVEVQRQFMRLEILMGTQKGHFAYRLAFENTSSSRIPFLPLHRRDLVLAEQGNRTYVDGGDGERINWRKFEIMGEVIFSIWKSREVGYPTTGRNEEVQRLVLDGRFCKDDDVLYERSLQIEAPGIGENTKRRFNWFQR